jgi:Zn-dependent M16 (insulinase) family peptidase
MLRKISGSASKSMAMRKHFFSDSAKASLAKDYQLNDRLHNFTVKKIEDFPDFKIKMLYLEHERLGSRYFHFQSPDPNNSFAVLLRTLPKNDRGTPHVLEHTVLCGSEKYPIRDPFFNMLKRSLNTYMNAWTGPDFTMYPFSTQNAKDYQNLLEVYCDSVFRSKINYEDFLQEGWRYDFENDKLKYKGIVYNEMKGVYENQHDYFYSKAFRELYLGSEYANNSGGEPAKIPELSYEELKSFYKLYYHPSNCSFISYGNFPFEKNLEFLEQNYLKNFERNDTIFFPKQPDLNEPKHTVITGPAEAMTVKEKHGSQFSISYLCDQAIKDPIDCIGLSLLSLLMFGFPKSPFYKEFIETDKCSGFCSGNGFEPDIYYPYFTIGLKNVLEDQGHIDQLKAEMLDLLVQLSEKGFDEKLIESTLHLFEINSKFGKENFGIQIFESFNHAVNYNKFDLIQNKMNIGKTLETLRHKIFNENYLQSLIKTYLLNNSKRSDITLMPDANFAAEFQQGEVRLLEEKSKQLTPDSIEKIKKDAELLAKNQVKRENFDVLPKLHVSDIAREIYMPTINRYQVDSVPVMFVEEFTNGVTHFRIKFDIRGFPESLVNHLYLFELFFNELGTKMMRYDEMNEQLNLFTNNLGVKNQAHSNFSEKSLTEHLITFEICCLDKNIDKMFELLTQFLTAVNFKDYERLLQLIKINGSQAANSFVSEAMSHALSVSESAFSPAARYKNYYANVT